MSQRWKTVIFSGTSLIVVASATSAILINRSFTEPQLSAKQELAQARNGKRIRNLSLQPEAARVNRRLGNRFKHSGRPESNLSGTLTVGTDQRPIRIVRQQTEDGETVEVQLAGRRLTWSDAEGIKASPGLASASERLLVERLVFDSPDQFVLAQLRGASYFTVTRNLRPNDAGDGYSGPTWSMVRVSEPQTGDGANQSNRWRLYYINELTDLIDRVTCEMDGDTITAEIQWTEGQQEQVLSRITWTRNGGTIMALDVAGFSHSN